MTSIRTKTALQCVGCLGLGAAYAKYRVEKKRFGHFGDFPNLERHYSSMAGHLTKTMHRHMKSFGQTPSGFTFDECIQPGVDIAGNSLGKKEPGIIAGDQECYTMFGDLFNAVIVDVHPLVKDHARSLDQLQLFNAQFDPKHVIAVKAQAFRNVVDFPYTPAITRGQRRKVETMVADAVADMPSDLSGKYQKIKDLDRRTFAELAQAEVNFTKPTGEVDVVAQLGRDWPDARGLFVNKAKDFTVWVNGRHHVEVSAHGKGGDLGKVRCLCDIFLYFLSWFLGWCWFNPPFIQPSISTAGCAQGGERHPLP